MITFFQHDFHKDTLRFINLIQIFMTKTKTKNASQIAAYFANIHWHAYRWCICIPAIEFVPHYSINQNYQNPTVMHCDTISSNRLTFGSMHLTVVTYRLKKEKLHVTLQTRQRRALIASVPK